MRRTVLPVAVLGVLLVACLPGPAPDAQPIAYALLERPLTLSEHYGLTAYPGSGLLQLRDEGPRVTAWFVSYIDALTLYAYFDAQLLAGGWHSLAFSHHGAREVRATYRRNDERLSLRLVLTGPDGRYRLELR